MGEAKHKAEHRKLVEAMHHDLIASGRLIEAGWAIMKLLEWPELGPGPEYDARRMAFFAGAQHLFAGIMITLDEGDEPTRQDVHRMDLVARELDQWAKEMKLRHARASGTA